MLIIAMLFFFVSFVVEVFNLGIVFSVKCLGLTPAVLLCLLH